MKKYIFYLSVCLSLLMSCTSSDVNSDSASSSNGNNNSSNNENNNSNEWLIPISEVKDGGPGKDGIPSIDKPDFADANTANFLSDNDLVVGIIKDNVAKAYPHLVLDWHEIVNDRINDSFFTLNYCPLTGTAFSWESVTNGVKSTFGVSGLLYNANLILYDRNTDSNWSQLRLECVNGRLINDKPKLYSVVETNWKTWKMLYPNTLVLNTQTGFSRNYGTYPYGDYSTNNSRFIFRPAITNSALPNKERVFAIIDGNKSKVYRFSNFDNGKVFKDTFNGKNYLIIGNKNLIYGFELQGDFIIPIYEYVFNNSEAFFKDNEGNKWSVFGKAIEGPNSGTSLTSAKSVMSYWFAIAAFYPNPVVYSEQ